jgi:hypothetical protein
MRLVLAILAIGTAAQAENGSLALQLPNPPMNYQSDRFRAGNLDCSNAVGGGTNLEFGVTGVINNVGGNYDPMNSYLNEQSKDIGVYARIVIPLDKPRARINCDDLYRLELKNRQLEILKLERELEQLKQLQQDMDFEN